MKIVGYRKMIMGILALGCYTTIMVLSNTSIDPLSLGIGIGMVIAPPSIANMQEHVNKKAVDVIKGA